MPYRNLPLQAGVAKIDITPYGQPVNIAGFGFERRSTGVHDPIYARVLHLSSQGSSVTLVSVDLIGLFHDTVESIRAGLAGEQGGAGHLIICSTHNHSGPDTMGYWGTGFMGRLPIRSGVSSDYMEMLVSRIKKAVVAARNDAEKVTARRGCAVAPPWLTSNLREPAFKDDTISWIRFDRTDGSRKAYIVNFACHSETLWKRNTLISADYPGELCKILEDNTGAAPIFFQGACGGKVTPNLEDEASLPDRVQYMKEIGEVISDRIIRSESASARMDDVSIAHSQRKVSIRLENRTFGMLRTIGVLKRKGGAATIESEINMIRIGDTLMFGAPGELLPSVGSMIKGRLAMSPSVMILGLCCDELGYILSAEEFEKPQYEFERSLCAGRNVTQEILKSVYELRARL